MGEVYLATMAALGDVAKPVALKLVRPDLARDPEFAALFVEEAKVAMSLSHANVVQAFDVGRIDDRWFLALELVDGVNLGEVLRVCRERLRQPMPRRHVVLVAVEMLKGLDYAHRRRARDGTPLSIVHRDVSPANVLISFEGEVKVADFGVAKSALREVGSMAGTIKGKIPYMAPEQLRGESVDRRADLYSVAAVLFEMLTGRRLFDDEAGAGVIREVLAGAHPRPRAVDGTISEELERIVMRGLAPERSDRHPNAAAMRQDLERFAASEGYQLSSTDLAEFVTEVCGDAKRRRPFETLASGSSMRPRGAAAGEAPLGVDEPALAGDFDALLGRALDVVPSDEPFSVLTARGKATAVTAKTAPHTSASRARAEHRTAPVEIPMGSARRVVAWLGVAALAITAVVVAMAMRDAPAERIAPDDDETLSSAVVEPALPRGADTPRETALRSDSDSDSDSDSEPDPDSDSDSESGPASALGARQPRPPRAHETAQAPAATPGRLSANTDPWSNVYVDGQLLGPTPLVDREVSSGEHRITFRNPSASLERTVVVRIGPGEHRRVTLDLARTP